MLRPGAKLVKRRFVNPASEGLSAHEPSPLAFTVATIRYPRRRPDSPGDQKKQATRRTVQSVGSLEHRVLRVKAIQPSSAGKPAGQISLPTQKRPPSIL